MVKKGKRRKETGKIVAKRRRHVRVSLPRVRWDIVVVVVLIALIVTASTIALTSHSRHKSVRKLSVDDLTKYLGELSKGNTSIALDLLYEVRGNVPSGNEVLGIKDVMQVDIRYYEFELAIPKNKTQTNITSASTKKVKGYLVFYYGLDYLPILNSLLGMSPSVDNLSRVLIDTKYLINATKGNIRIISEGYEDVKLGDLGVTKALKELIVYSRHISNKTYSVSIHAWLDPKFRIPLKVKVLINGYELELRLKTFMVRPLGRTLAKPA